MNANRKSPVRSVLLSLLVTLALGAVYFYAFIPALNIHSSELYTFIIVLCLIYLLSKAAFSGTIPGGQSEAAEDVIFDRDENGIYHINRAKARRRQRKRGNALSALLQRAPKNIPMVIIALCILVGAIGSLSSATLFHADAYYNLMNVETGDFTQDVAEISYSEIPMLDEASARQLGKRALGSISSNTSLVSQFEVSYDYSQINYQSQPVRVACLEYGDLIKWFNNRSDGLPGYIVVNMCTQEATLVQLPEGIRYATCEHFNRNLYRHLRFRYPTYIFGDVNFEIDESGHPWWVCSRETYTISLFGGRDVIGAVLVDAVTGECYDYDMASIPTWVDRVFDSDLIVEQYNYHGTLVNGWINSWLGQKAVTTTTGDYQGYNFLALNDDVYLYTGITSAGGDESIVGFILVNQRTKEARYYNITGAEEYSAMSSAQGAVQHLNYSATFPILLNISGQPTYFMALKDSAELVKMYAMVSVSDYQITATGPTVAECQINYEALLAENGVTITAPVEVEELTGEETVIGTISDLRSAVIDGNTWFYLRLEEEPERYYAVSAKDSPQAIIANVGDRVTLRCIPSEEPIVTAAGLTLG